MVRQRERCGNTWELRLYRERLLSKAITTPNTTIIYLECTSKFLKSMCGLDSDGFGDESIELSSLWHWLSFFALRLSRTRALAPNSRIIIIAASQDDTHGDNCLCRPHYLVGNSWQQSQVGLPRREFARSVRRGKSHRVPALRVLSLPPLAPSSLRSLPRPSPARAPRDQRVCMSGSAVT